MNLSSKVKNTDQQLPSITLASEEDNDTIASLPQITLNINDDEDEKATINNEET